MPKLTDEPWAKFVSEIGLDPYNTESQARRVAQHAVERIAVLNKRIRYAEDDASRLRYPDTTGQ